MIDFDEPSRYSNWAFWFLRTALIFGFLLMFARLFELQVIRGNYYYVLAEENRVRKIPIIAPRGAIVDRNGEIIVESKKLPDDRSDQTPDLNEDVIVKWERTYKGPEFGHVIGYLGFVGQQEVGKVRGGCPQKGVRKSGSFVGRTGLEEYYDCQLAGIDGEELVEVDAMGVPVRSLGVKEPTKGDDVKTTIDIGLQRKMAEYMEGKKGAIVALTPQGETLGIYSAPSYDPAIFVTKEKAKEVSKILNDQNLPLFNRALGGMFHPGSIYKPLVSIAALEEGAIRKDYTYDDNGRITVDSNYGSFSYNNWYFTQYGGKEGVIGLERALARSTDTFFYEIGDLLGIQKLEKWSNTFGLSEKTGIDLPGEIAGLVPSPEWKQKVKGERWYLGNTYHMAIGQGDLAVTPLAITSAIASIAADGEWCRPTLAGNTECKDLKLKKEYVDIVTEGMRQACATGGTAFPFFDFELPDGSQVACKTGTAETEGGDDGDTHAWFTIFAPMEDPEIVMTILVERGGEGSKEAAPIARKLFDYWFYEKYGKEVPKKVLPSPSPSVSPSVSPSPVESM